MTLPQVKVVVWQRLGPELTAVRISGQDSSFSKLISVDGPSKAACIHLSKQQASKLAPKNILVNAVCPGVFPSRMTSYGVDKFLDTLLVGQPTGRIGQPSDFAGLILFLSSKASAHITGNVISIDGGSLISGWRRAAKPESKI